MKRLAILGVAWGIGLFAAPAAADCRALTVANVATCAVTASASVRAEREGVLAAEGRRTAAAPWVPSSPVLSFTAAQRHVTGSDAFNYHASLSQELEVAGQRASRRRAAEADVAAKANDTTAVARKVAANALVAWFDAAAARDAVMLAKRIEQSGAMVAKAVRARADSGVGSELDAEVASAAALRLTQSRLDAERAEATARAQLGALVGAEGRELTIEGAIEPLPAPGRVDLLPELRALQDEKRAHEERAAGFRRSRFPTLTLSIFAENDGFNERVLGAGLSLPLPLPSPIGHTFRGEADESEALARQAAARAEAITRLANGERATAKLAYDSAQASVALYTDERVGKSERLLDDIGREIEGGRLAMRDALFAQQELVGLLKARIDAKRALALASVDLAVASGTPLERK